MKQVPLHGGQMRHIADRFGLPESELLDFSANINPAGPPPAVLASLRASLEDVQTLTQYPDLEETELKRAIARYARARPNNVAVANGFVPLLEAAVRALGVRRCLVPVPAFVEYRRTLERAGVSVEPHRLHAEDGFRYDVPALLDGEHDAILLANPQNPSGVCHDPGLLRELVTGAAERHRIVLLDEAFIDYAPEHSLSGLARELPNLVVFRSVTKFHGMPGLRVAYALSRPACTAALTQALPPWPITTLASRAVAAGLQDQAYAEDSLAVNSLRRDKLERDLRALGLLVYPSAANFLLFRLANEDGAETFWSRMILEQRIVLRDCANYEALAGGHFRAAVRGEGENARLVRALRETIARISWRV